MTEDEGNVIIGKEFGDIEKKEREVKKKRFGFFKKKEPVSVSPKPQNVEGPLQKAILKLERLGGRVEVLESVRPETNEKISSVIEKIGELRSSLIERDRSYNKLEKDFDKISEVAKELELDDIFKNLEKKDAKIEKTTAIVESLNDKVSIISKKFAAISSSVEQIKGLKDVVTITEGLNKKISIIEELKSKTEKSAGKVDSLFYELKETYNKMQTHISKIEVNEDSIKELLRTVDRLSMKVEDSSSKENMEKLKNECENKLVEFKFDANSKIGELADMIKEVNRKVLGGTKTDVQVLKEIIRSKIVNLPELKDNLPEKEYIEKKFLGFEIALVELSKSIDDKIENKLELSGNVPAEIKSSYRRERVSPSINKLNITKPSQDEEPSTREDKINRLINYIDTLISSGNYETAKEYYIKLLSEYERYEDSNPHILVKIAQFHDKLKN